MSFAIDLPNEIQRKIGLWGISARLQSELLERLYEELAESPTRHLKRLANPSDILEYSYCVEREGIPPYDYLFSFSIAYATDEETLIVRDCEYLRIESS
jgi:hypothetical protein